MKVCVLGAGAMGCSIGGLLADGGSEVHLLDTWAGHVNAINSEGLKLRVGSSERVVPVQAATDCRGIGPADLIIALVKSLRVVRIAEEFERAGLLITVSSNIIGIMWDKLLVNVATGALCGITRLSYGGLYKMPELMDCALAAVAEGIAVAKAIGVKLSTKDPREAWFKASEGLPEDFKPSLLQSLEKGLRTEIDFINGAVVRYGEKCKVPTPVNRTLVAGIRGMEYAMTHYAKKA